MDVPNYNFGQIRSSPGLKKQVDKLVFEQSQSRTDSSCYMNESNVLILVTQSAMPDCILH